MNEELLNKAVKEKFGTWKAFADHLGVDRKNLKRNLLNNVDRLDERLNLLGLELELKPKAKD